MADPFEKSAGGGLREVWWALLTCFSGSVLSNVLECFQSKIQNYVRGDRFLKNIETCEKDACRTALEIDLVNS